MIAKLRFVKEMNMPTKKDLRENLSLPTFENSSETELFQNNVLRPVLKLQNDIFIQIFRDYAMRKMSDFTSLKNEQKINFTEQSLQKDIALKNTFIGMTIGMLTPEEITIYLSDSKSFNKRIINMLSERIKSQIEAL
ncbi:glyoxalase [Chryseobacterium gambrini]|uniref:Glyoxalase n=1 Tax=Chryseobacterium gambrini TaxID=373672 RepID=A0AAJ1R5N3_9FLAO|nr:MULTISPECIES: glyoxalase [Chryseobacterium]MDN4014099.1 glyoxalase [Chryseobacterium gambrini]MDN4028154.1 glyoxalase [Chryseobacterium gambrini]